MEENGRWSVEAVRDWAKDLFASRDEAARIAHEEAAEAREGARRETDREVRRLDEMIEREIEVRDKRLDELNAEMARRLQEERAFRDEVKGQSLTRDQYQREHRALEMKHDSDVDSLSKRVGRNETMLANIQGKAVVYAILGSIFLATATAIITHLLSGT